MMGVLFAFRGLAVAIQVLLKMGCTQLVCWKEICDSSYSLFLLQSNLSGSRWVSTCNSTEVVDRGRVDWGCVLRSLLQSGIESVESKVDRRLVVLCFSESRLALFKGG